MMAGGGGSAVAGGSALHIPVLGRSAVELLQPGQGGVYIDGTFGAGGYTRAILAAADCSVIGIDRDQTAIALGADLVDQAGGRLTLIEDRFSNLDAIARDAGLPAVDGVVLDLGVSSMQLDTARRGFSFRLDGPLDMRMGGEGPSAADVVNKAERARSRQYHFHPRGGAALAFRRARHRQSARRCSDLKPRARSRTLLRRSCARVRTTSIRRRARFRRCASSSTTSLANWRRHLHAAERVIKPGGRLVVVSFHSLEDRIVKTFLVDRSGSRGGSRHAPEVDRPAPTFRTLTKRPITADDEEIAHNPRARSAKLRAAERTDAAARAEMPSNLLPDLPSLADVAGGR